MQNHASAPVDRLRFARFFGSSILSQGLLSAANLLTGLILVRRVAPEQYGFYVLINSAILLLSQQQSALINPSLAARVTIAGAQERGGFIGGLLREQRRLLLLVAAGGLLVCAFTVSHSRVTQFAALGVVAATAWLFRDLFRMVLTAHRLSYEVFKGDVIFATCLVAGAWLATLSTAPGALAVLSVGAAATLSGWWLFRRLWQHEPWSIRPPPGALGQSARLGAWAAAGSTIHWLFGQGYTFIVAARLDVSAVAAIAATRLLLSPIGVFSMGISNGMYSTATLWLQQHGARGLLRRVLLFAAGMACATGAYLVVIWMLRDWIFVNVIHRSFPQRDLLLGLWSLVFLCTVVRDQVIFLLIAHLKWKLLAALTLFCAFIGLTVSFLATERFGAAGGLLGLLSAEAAHVLGVILLTFRHMRRGSDIPSAISAPS